MLHNAWIWSTNKSKSAVVYKQKPNLNIILQLQDQLCSQQCIISRGHIQHKANVSKSTDLRFCHIISLKLSDAYMCR